MALDEVVSRPLDGVQGFRPLAGSLVIDITNLYGIQLVDTYKCKLRMLYF